MNTRLEWLQKELSDLVNDYEQDCTRHKKNALRLKLTSIFFAALITALLGLKLNAGIKEVFSNIVLVLGALITVLSAYEAFFDPRALWVKEKVRCARLKDLQRDINYWTSGLDAGQLDTDTVEHFKRRLDYILEDSLKYLDEDSRSARTREQRAVNTEARPGSAVGDHAGYQNGAGQAHIASRQAHWKDAMRRNTEFLSLGFTRAKTHAEKNKANFTAGTPSDVAQLMKVTGAEIHRARVT